MFITSSYLDREIGRETLITGIESNFAMPFEPTKLEITSEKPRFRQQKHVHPAIKLLVLAIERPHAQEQDGARAFKHVELSNSII